jgi:hypothetical protein
MSATRLLTGKFRILNRNQIQGLAYPKEDMLLCKLYNTGDKLQLGLFYCSQLLFILLPNLLSFQLDSRMSLIAVRYISVWIIVGFQQIN